MSALDPSAFHAAFRFHPRAWRAENEDVAAGILMDAADADGRSRPTVADRISLAGHAATVWMGRALPQAAADRLASIALGPGIGLGVVLVAVFAIETVRGDGGSAAGPLVSGTALLAPWLGAAFLVFSGRAGSARAAMGVAVITCLAIGVARLGFPSLALPSTRTLLALGMLAALAALGRARSAVVGAAAGLTVIAGLLVLLAVGQRALITQRGVWTALAAVSPLPLLGVFLCLFTAAALGHRSVAIGGTLAAAPWAALSIVGQFLDGQQAQALMLLVAAWASAAVAVVLTAHGRATPGPRRRGPA